MLLYKIFEVIFLRSLLPINTVLGKHHFTYLTIKIILSGKCNTSSKSMRMTRREGNKKGTLGCMEMNNVGTSLTFSEKTVFITLE